MARGWYSYHTETPQEYFEEQYQIYIDTEMPAWARYNALTRMDKVFNYLNDMPYEQWIENYTVDRSQKRLYQIRYSPVSFQPIEVTIETEREKTAFQHYFYIVEMYDRYGRFLWTKIGATKNFNRRMKQHLGYYEDVYHIENLLIFDTKDIPAEEVENKVRTYLLKRYGREQYIPNDRFTRKINVDYIRERLPFCLNALREAEIPV